MERFMEIFQNIKEHDSQIDFNVERCTVLPELLEEGGYDDP